MKVRIVLDVACAWSFLGFTHYLRAAERFRAEGGVVETEFLPFQVAPDASADGEPLREVHRRVFGPSAEERTAEFAAIAARSGLDVRFDRVVFANTRPAHDLIARATAQGAGERAVALLFDAYFTEGRNVADPAVLRDVAARSGVDAAADMVADFRATAELGVRSVPLFLFEDGTTISGAQSPDAFLTAFRGVLVGR
ncbi:DsbA family oxidoreductase [Streptomyces mobaraensis]|uniref:DsbA family oxidoreductase n=1 Tax=Streptomyces mobaraensis TaxID=35621 RepID=A0A5N5W450_STRMB|nr:DsbA family oxidoreductase [Streptomyces mobaraensis]KAB7839598.1 DsbA family oxidoreductase [Streptomyces mobaraensis]